MADAFSKDAFASDLAEAKTADEAERWSIEEKGDLEIWVTLSPIGSGETFAAQLQWLEYPGSEPPSVKFVDPASGRLDIATAWPIARGFRPGSFDICATWTREGFQIHPEWRNDPVLKWRSDGNLVLKSLRTLHDELDITFQGRFKG